MAVKPILFNTKMVRAILDGTKTQTRRLVSLGMPCYFAPGDIMWVRETWRREYIKEPNNGRGTPVDFKPYEYRYRADGEILNSDGTPVIWTPCLHMPKKAARIFLRVKKVHSERLQDISPKDASLEGVGRMYLDLIAEGVKDYGCDCDVKYGLAKEQFAWLWDSTIKKADLPKHGWKANPSVWVIEFERCEKPEGWCAQ